MKITLLAAVFWWASLANAETLSISFTMGPTPLANAPGGESDSFITFTPSYSGNTFSFTGIFSSTYTGNITYDFGIVDPASGEMLDTIELVFSNSCAAIAAGEECVSGTAVEGVDSLLTPGYTAVNATGAVNDFSSALDPAIGFTIAATENPLTGSGSTGTPEPGTFGLIGLGAAGLLFKRGSGFRRFYS